MALLESSHFPVSTYRVQLHGKFTFADLGNLTPYFRSLGISDFYLSPIFTATPGSKHGYDVTDYGKVNPELGGGDGFDLLAGRLRTEGLNVLLDFVPNHMGIAGVLNQWWRDVLENGQLSPYEPFFDIQWKDEGDREHPRVLVPVLEDHYGKVLEEGKITLSFADEFSLRYYDLALPVSPSSYVGLLDSFGASQLSPEDSRTVASLADGFASLPKTNPDPVAETSRKRVELVDAQKKKTAAAFAASPGLRAQLEARLKTINGTPGTAGSFAELHALIEKQNYRLARWKTGTHEINYRRFFAIDSLVGLHMEKPEVFRACHELLGRLVREGKVAGLRIDHIDGLRQPEDYLRRLQSLERPDNSKPLYVLVEKILARGEVMPEAWPVHGTTGYEFIPELAGVLVDGSAEKRLDQIYRDFTGESGSVREIVQEKKRMIIAEMFANAVNQLGSELVEILVVDRRWRDLTRHELTTAVSELVANLPVYRTYRRRQEPVSGADRVVLEQACTRALASNPRAEPQPFEFVRDLLIGTYPGSDAPENYRTRLLNWVLTFQQYTGAVMAKAVEDTAFYTYNRLIALNEVGDSLGDFSGSVAGFHRVNEERLAHSPHAMLATSTHDTKFSEDIRARLYALSEIPDEWETWVRDWSRLAARHATPAAGKTAPDALDQYRFFQVLLGVWPLAGKSADAELRERLREHFRKAVNEAKRHTSIVQANEEYLSACDRFVDGITSAESGADFLAAFVPAAQRIARLGVVNSLSQLVLKCTVPGVPDIYQGNEVWDFSLVDPDNRRDVDYGYRQKLLEEVNRTAAGLLLQNWHTGGIKLRVTQRLLALRKKFPALFTQGSYEPVEPSGIFCDRLIAYVRHYEDKRLLVVVPRCVAKLGSPPLGLVWDDTSLPWASGASEWRDVVTDRKHSALEPLLARILFSELPFAVLESV